MYFSMLTSMPLLNKKNHSADPALSVYTEQKYVPWLTAPMTTVFIPEYSNSERKPLELVPR